MSSSAAPTDYRALLKAAYVEIKGLRSRLTATEHRRHDPIAIVGMSCRFPGGADDPAAFWRLLRDGYDAVTEVPADRWDVNEFYDPDPGAPGKSYSRWGAFLRQIDQFDPRFFNINPREAASMDPQQRLLLEVSWEALEDAGYASASSLKDSATGVFVGISTNDYAVHLASVLGDDAFDPYFGTSSTFSVAAGRIAYTFGLQGPCMAIDTACSSSLVAVHLACQSLRAGECETALAGGVNIILSPSIYVYMSKARMLSFDGHCHAFDAGANGFVRGEGCGVVLLKRLSDAQRDRDHILAVIRGTRINQDGRSAGLTAPNGPAQQMLIQQALDEAGVGANAMQYLEAHGTGTELGDPIEIQAIAAVMNGRPKVQPLLVGSVKTNIGHLEAAAGVAGLIKVVLAMQHAEIPPHLHLRNPSSHIAWDRFPITVPTRLRTWPQGSEPRVAGISSFGFSGTNAHVIVQEPPPMPPTQTQRERPLHVLTLSASTSEALRQIAGRYTSYLSGESSARLADICFTANVGRTHLNQRWALIAETLEDARNQLSEVAAEGVESERVIRALTKGAPLKVGFLCTGQGSQYVGMGRELYETQPTFRKTLEQCDELLGPYLPRSLLSVIYPDDAASSLLDETQYTQPALFVLEYALAQLWRSWGIEPSFIFGHSVGEFVAACLAGIFSLHDGLKLVAHRGRLMQALPDGGAMAALSASQEQVAAAISRQDQQVSIAAINGPSEVVISGPRAAVEELAGALKSDGAQARLLSVSHAFHSALMDPMLDDFERVASEAVYSSPRIRMISGLTGHGLQPSSIPDASYWRRQARSPVQFAAAMNTLQQLGCNLLIEMGPKPTLIGLGRRCLPDAEIGWLPSLREGQRDWQQMLHSLRDLYACGATIDWSGFDRDYTRHRVALPTYPFQRQRCWLDGTRTDAASPALLGNRAAHKSWRECLWELKWTPSKKDVDGERRVERGHWIIFTDRGVVGANLAALLAAQGDTYAVVVPDGTSLPVGARSVDPSRPEDFRRILDEAIKDDQTLRGVVYLWGLDETSPADSVAGGNLGLIGALHLLQALAVAERRRAPLWVGTCGAQRLGREARPLALWQSLLWGLGRVIAWEYPSLWGGLVDLDPDAPAQSLGADLLRCILNPVEEDQVALRGGALFTARLVRCTSSFGGEPVQLRKDATYLIAGGLGGLGLQVARWLVNLGAKHLALVGRSAPSPKAQDEMRAMAQLGAEVRVFLADITRRDELAQTLREMNDSMPPLRGVIHSAGVLDDGVLANLSSERFAPVLAPKVTGAWHLHELTLDHPLDFFSLFSSSASILGAPGQGNYAAANAFLDALAHYRQGSGLPAQSLNWGPWAEVGMARDQAASFRARGLGVLDPAECLKALSVFLKSDLVQVVVLPIQDSIAFETDEIAPSSIISRQAMRGKFESRQESLPTLERFLESVPEEQEEFLRAWLLRRIASALLVTEDQVHEKSNLLELGVDSLMVMEILNDITRSFQLTLYPREFYQRPAVHLLAPYLATEINRAHVGEPAQSDVLRVPLRTASSSSFSSNGSPRSVICTRNPGIIFVLSSPRSGSTLLRVMLAGHSALFSPPELHLLPFDNMLEWQAKMGETYLSEGLQRALMELLALDAESSRALLLQQAEKGQTVQEVYAMLQKLAAPRILVDKSPLYAGDLATLRRAEELFEGARFIHLTRHPYAMIESFVRMRIEKLMDAGSANSHALGEEVWRSSNQHLSDFAAEIGPERFYRLRFEDLVRDPTAAMTSLCQFLGVPFEPSVTRPYEGSRMTDGVYEHSMPVSDPRFLSHHRIEPELGEAWRHIRLPQLLGPQTEKLARQLGYELPQEDASANAQIGSESEELSWTETFQHAGDQRLCVCSWGQPTAAPIVCLHGLLEHGAMWDFVARKLASSGHQVIAPDLRGHGRSDHVPRGSSYNLVDYLADINALLETLPGGGPITLVGHSMGALLASFIAAMRPELVAALVLVECLSPEETREPELLEQVSQHLSYLSAPPAHPFMRNLDEAAARLRVITPSLPKDAALKMAQRITVQTDGGLKWRWDSLLRTRSGPASLWMSVPRARYAVLLSRMRAATTIIRGETGVFNRPEELAWWKASLPAARWYTLPGGHNLHVDAPHDVARIIAEASSS